MHTYIYTFTHLYALATHTFTYVHSHEYAHSYISMQHIYTHTFATNMYIQHTYICKYAHT